MVILFLYNREQANEEDGQEIKKNGTKMGHPKKPPIFFQKPTNKGVKNQKIRKKVPISKKWAL